MSSIHMENIYPAIDLNIPKRLEEATFALGWFWGPDARFGLTKGVYKTRVGYAGGAKKNPNYHDLGDHSETVQIEYNPSEITYGELLNIFWNSHTPANEPWGRQYMSVIFYQNDIQKGLAIKSKNEHEKKIGKKLYTEILPLTNFHLAETYHQKYYLQLARELATELKDIYPKANDFINSTATAHINGYIKGYGSMTQLTSEIKRLGLSEKAQKRLIQIVDGYGK